MSNTIHKTVTTEDAGLRLDKYLSQWPEIGSRGKAASLLETKSVLVDDRAERPSYSVCEGDVVLVEIAPPVSDKLEPYDLALDILHEDADILVVNKPSGLVVHPAAGHTQDTLVNALIAHTDDLAMGFGENRPGIVHRLDKETSGLLVVAKNDLAQENLAAQFQARTVHRIYQALLIGALPAPSGTIQSYLARHQTDRKRYASVRGGDKKIIRSQEPPANTGKWAITTYKNIAQKHGLAFTELKLKTGRTHQIRVHVADMGHPLVGDIAYGGGKRINAIESGKIRHEVTLLDRFMLHARELGFKHPTTGKEMMFERNWPEKDLALLREWGFQP